MSQTSLDDRLAAAALVLIGRSGWNGCTAAKLAKAAKATQPQASAFLANPCYSMRCLAGYLTRMTLRSYRHDPSAKPRDALFDLLMLRFETLQQYRPAILSVAKAAHEQPALAAALAGAIPAQMTDLLAAARLPQTPPHRFGLAAIYLLTLRVWRNDQTSDLARTMAALDGHLRRTESVLEKLQQKPA